MKHSIFHNRTALITGGSSGIGFELAKLLCAEGAGVVLAASGRERLEAAADALERTCGRRPEIAVADLSDPAAPKKLFDELQRRKLSVDILVNNAGFGTLGAYIESDPKRSLDMIEVNVQAVAALARYFAPPMAARGRGWILNVASTAAFQPIPLEAVYGASKAFVLSFSVALHEELKSRGVAVSCLCPGPTDTAFFAQGGFRKTSKMLRARVPVGPVARQGLEGLRRNRPIVIPGIANALGAFGTRLATRAFAAKVAKKVVE